MSLFDNTNDVGEKEPLKNDKLNRKLVTKDLNNKKPKRGTYLEYLLKKYKLEEIYNNRKVLNKPFSAETKYSYFKELITSLFDNFDLSSTEMEEIFIELYIVIKQNVNKYICPSSLIFLMIIKKVRYDLYIKIKNSSINYTELEEELASYNKVIKWLNNNGIRYYGPKLKGMLLWIIDDRREVQTIKDKLSQINTVYCNEKKVLEQTVNTYDGVVQNRLYSGLNNEKIREELFKNVELHDKDVEANIIE